MSFVIDVKAVSADGHGSGEIRTSWEPDWTTHVINLFEAGTSISVQSRANSDSIFDRWEQDGEVIKSSAYSFTVKSDSDIIAYFRYPIISLSVSPTGGGTVSGGGFKALGSTATITATPADKYMFLGWYEGSVLKSTQSSYEFIVKSDVNYTAKFKRIIDEFNWLNTISPNEPITNLTSADWKNIQDKIDAVRGEAYTDWIRAASSEKLTAAMFEQVRTRIAILPGCGDIVSEKYIGDKILAAYFDGDGSTQDTSLRAALNRAINY